MPCWSRLREFEGRRPTPREADGESCCSARSRARTFRPAGRSGSEGILHSHGPSSRPSGPHRTGWLPARVAIEVLRGVSRAMRCRDRGTSHPADRLLRSPGRREEVPRRFRSGTRRGGRLSMRTGEPRRGASPSSRYRLRRRRGPEKGGWPCSRALGAFGSSSCPLRRLKRTPPGRADPGYHVRLQSPRTAAGDPSPSPCQPSQTLRKPAEAIARAGIREPAPRPLHPPSRTPSEGGLDLLTALPRAPGSGPGGRTTSVALLRLTRGPTGAFVIHERRTASHVGIAGDGRRRYACSILVRRTGVAAKREVAVCRTSGAVTGLELESYTTGMVTISSSGD